MADGLQDVLEELCKKNNMDEEKLIDELKILVLEEIERVNNKIQGDFNFYVSASDVADYIANTNTNYPYLQNFIEKRIFPELVEDGTLKQQQFIDVGSENEQPYTMYKLTSKWLVHFYKTSAESQRKRVNKLVARINELELIDEFEDVVDWYSREA